MKIKYEKFLPYIYLIIGESFSGRHHLYAYWLVLSHPTTLHSTYLGIEEREKGRGGNGSFPISSHGRSKKKERRGNEFQTGSSHANEWGRGDFIVHIPSLVFSFYFGR